MPLPRFRCIILDIYIKSTELLVYILVCVVSVEMSPASAASTPDNVGTHEQIVASLCAAAPSDAIRNCLHKYVPTKHGFQIEAAFKQEKKQTLVATLAYLRVPDMNQYKADCLPHELLCRVQNLFPDSCHLCQQEYCVALQDNPIASCANCGQGCHNACVLQLLGISEDDLNEANEFGLSVLNPYAKVGLVYLCGACQKDVLPQKERLKTKNAANVTHNSNVNPQTDHDGSEVEESLQENSATTEVSAQQNDTIHTNISTPATREPPLRQNSSQSNQSALGFGPVGREGSQTNSAPNAQPTAICKFYRRGRCKYGISGKKDGPCTHSHPKVCQSYMQNGPIASRGCTRGNNCRFFHPNLCKTSVTNRTCHNEGCKFIHLRGTKRSSQLDDADANNSQRPTAHPSSQTSRGTKNLGTSTETNNSSKYASVDGGNFLEMFSQLNCQIVQLSSKLQQMDLKFSSLVPPVQPLLHADKTGNVPFPMVPPQQMFHPLLFQPPRQYHPQQGVGLLSTPTSQ